MFNTGGFNDVRFNSGENIIELEASISAVSSVENDLSITISLESIISSVSSIENDLSLTLSLVSEITSISIVENELALTLSLESEINVISNVENDLSLILSLETEVSAILLISDTTLPLIFNLETSITSISSVSDTALPLIFNLETSVSAISFIDDVEMLTGLELNGSISCISTVSDSSLVATLALAGSITCISTVSNAIIVFDYYLEIKVNTITDCYADMSREMIIIGQIGSASSLTAGLVQTVSITSSLTPISNVTSIIEIFRGFEATVDAISSVSDTTFDTQTSFEVTIASESLVIGEITYYNYFETNIVAISSITIELGITISMAGTIDSVSAVSGQFYSLFIDAQYSGLTDYIHLTWTEA